MRRQDEQGNINQILTRLDVLANSPLNELSVVLRDI